MPIFLSINLYIKYRIPLNILRLEIKMDKRKQFQLQLLVNKLAEYTTKLETLKSKQLELSNSIQNISTQNELADMNKLNLLEQKNILEARIQVYKNNLSNYRGEYAQLNHQQKLLPIQLDTHKKQELAIYEEEIHNITGRTQEATQEHLDKLALLEIEKCNLSNQILDLQSDLTAAQDNISNIQENAHAYRKNTILELQQKKQQKRDITITLEELNKNKELYITNFNEVSSRLDNLIELKTNIINTYYTNPKDILQTTNARELLPKELFDITMNSMTANSMTANSMTTNNINPSEILNTIVAYLDKQIQDARYQLTSISKKNTRLEKSISTTASKLKTRLELTSREKVISYKNNYKNAKLEKINLEGKLNELQARLDSWESEILENVKLEYKTTLDSLDAEKQRAQERLNIMTSRIINDFESNMISLTNQIKHIENELNANNNILKQASQELATLQEQMHRNNLEQVELDKINIQITNVEQSIEKIQQDINSLSK